MAKNSTSVFFTTEHPSSVAGYISAWIAHRDKSLRNGAAPCTSSTYASELPPEVRTGSLHDGDLNLQRDHSVVGQIRKSAAGRALLGLAMAVGPFSGRP